MRRLIITLAALVLARADMYPDASNAKLPEAQQNLGIQAVGAKCDGTTDDTAAINAAMLAASTAPAGRLSEVVLPKGTCMTGTVPLYTGVNLKGQGINQTILKLKPNTCADVMLGQGAYGLFGSDVGIGIGNFSISEMTIDGNRANQTGCADIDKTSGVVFYGYKPVFRNLVIQNVLGHGMRSEWQLWGTMPGGLDGDIQNLTIINTGRHGWWNNGPHDFSSDHLHIVNASLEADATYIGLYEDPKGGGRYFNFHGYVDNGAITTRPKYQYSTAGNSEFVASHFEGARQQIELRGGITRISDSRVYWPFAANNAMIDIRSSGNMLTNMYIHGQPGQANWAVDIGPGGEAPFQNVITGRFDSFGLTGPFKITSDGGQNKIDGVGWVNQGTAAPVTGTPASTTTVCYYQQGTNSQRTCNLQGTHLRSNLNVISEYLTNATSEVAMNYDGYSGGITQYRNLSVYDGKHALIAKFDGASKLLQMGGTTSAFAGLKGVGAFVYVRLADDSAFAGLRANNLDTTNLTMVQNRIEEYASNSAVNLGINYNGYQGGTTQFRSTTIYDGKQGRILLFDGPSKHLWLGIGTPVLSACGTSPVIAGTDTAGTITMGTGSPTSCTITFASAYASPPQCTVTWQTNLASMQYVLAADKITLTQTAMSSNKVNYTCFGSSGG